MPKNKLSDLNDHLFAALERLNDDDLSSEKIDEDSKRASAIIGLSSQILKGAEVTLNAAKLLSNGDVEAKFLPQALNNIHD